MCHVLSPSFVIKTVPIVPQLLCQGQCLAQVVTQSTAGCFGNPLGNPSGMSLSRGLEGSVVDR